MFFCSFVGRKTAVRAAPPPAAAAEEPEVSESEEPRVLTQRTPNVSAQTKQQGKMPELEQVLSANRGKKEPTRLIAFFPFLFS